MATNALAPPGLNALAETYQRYIGRPFAQLAGGGIRGYFGLDAPAYASELGMEAYRNAQALSNAPGVGAPAGAFKAAAKVVPEAAMFIGALAKTWDRASNTKAAELEKAGVNARKIWEETGNWRGPDGMWRQEISDAASFYDKQALKDVKLSNPAFDYRQHTQPMGGVLGHKSLYEAYPDLSDIQTHFMPVQRAKEASGGYSANLDRITLLDAPVDQRSTAIHEIQHAIQQREGFSQGTNPNVARVNKPEASIENILKLNDLADEYRQIWRNEAKGMGLPRPGGLSIREGEIETYYDAINKLPDPKLKAKFISILDKIDDQRQLTFGLDEGISAKMLDYKAYARTAGEAEARATQSRINLSPAQRRALFPEESYDVPINQLIIRR